MILEKIILSPPARFEIDEMEAEFQLSYKKAGLYFSKIALTIALVVAIIFWLTLLLFQVESQASSRRQFLRLILIMVLSASILNLNYRPKEVLNSYAFNLGFPVAICSMIVGFLGFIPLDSGNFAINRFIGAMILICWLVYGFTRLPLKLSVGICGFSSLLSLLSVALHHDDHSLAILIYLTGANFVGWISAVQIERRERVLFAGKTEIVRERNIANRNLQTAQAADHAKSRILAAVNHDLRQPLASLALYVGQLREQLPDGDASLHATADCLDACVTAISSDLDHLAELGAEAPGGHVPVDMVDLRTVLERVVRVYGGLARDAGIRLALRLPEGGGLQVWSNESRLWDILSNLVSNALKFGEASRERWVLVRVRRRRNRWIVVVQDNGIGIPAEDQSLIFDEYFRVSGAERSRRSGQGLGLSIARDAVAKLEGHAIDVCSRVGHGTRFTLEIPAAPVVAASTAAQARGPAAEALVRAGVGQRWKEGDTVTGPAGAPRAFAAGDTGGTRGPADDVSCPVLLVEDDEAMSDVLCRTLERWGFSVRRAGSGEEAIELTLAAQDLLTAIVSDFRLPGGWDGLRLIEQLRTLEGQRTPALLLSGEFRVETLRNDAPNDVRIMSKPPDIARLRAFLEQARSAAS